jgi:hypothetical protein
MIKRDEINYNSSFGRVTNNMLLTHGEGSKNIAILFPGGDNSTDVPTLHYARKAALLSGCDVLCLEYGCSVGYNTLSQPEILNKVANECEGVIRQCIAKDYKKIFFISKSIGHVISFRIDEKLGNKINHICYTPINANVDDILKRECIVFTGTKDKLLTVDSRKILSNRENIKLVIIENAVHSLEIDDNYKESIRILEYVTDKCSEFIKVNSFIE